MHLTEDQITKLKGRQDIPAAARRDNEFAVRNRLKEFLEFVPDANLILGILPADQLQKSSKLTEVLNQKTIIGLLDLVGKLADMLTSVDTTRDTATAAMKLTEKLIEHTAPAEWDYVDEEHRGKSPVITTRRFKVKLSDQLPGLSDSIAYLTATYEPDNREIEYIRSIRGHIRQIKTVAKEASKDHHLYTPDEFNKNVLPKLKTLKKFNVTTSIVGTPERDISKEEAIEQLKEAERIFKAD
jgi:hypothetical protein